MQLFTGEINYANSHFYNQPFDEKKTFCEYMVNGNDNCMALFSAWALLNFAAYLLQGLREEDAHADHEGFRLTSELIKSVLFQMLKCYVLVSVVQDVFGLSTFFLFREQQAYAFNGHGLLPEATLQFFLREY